MRWADLEWYLALLPMGPWASYIMPRGLHSLVPELGNASSPELLVPSTVTVSIMSRRERQSRSMGDPTGEGLPDRVRDLTVYEHLVCSEVVTECHPLFFRVAH